MIVMYNASYEEAWDEFVLQRSINGNFLQTRNFLNYHRKNKFIDGSLLFMKKGIIEGVFPANVEKNGKLLISHRGSTFGGLILGEEATNISSLDWIFEEFLDYIERSEFEEVIIRMPSWLYYRTDHKIELLDYYFEQKHFIENREVGFFIDLFLAESDFENHYAKLKKRKLKKAFQNKLLFRRLESDKEIGIFYQILENNMKKFGTVPVHSLQDLIEYKNSRLKNIVNFYGVFHDSNMIAGSMVFNFCNKKTFHTQYLASDASYLELCPNEFLYHELIQEAKRERYHYLSFGTATLAHGAVFNKNLALFKEGFHTETYVNPTFLLKVTTREK